MKILARSVLILIALSLVAFGDQFDSTGMNAVPFGIVAEDSDADLDETKCGPFFGFDAAIFSVSDVGKSALMQTSSQSLTLPITWYKPLSVHRPG